MTIDDAIATLSRLRDTSTLGGDTVLIVSLTASEMDIMPVEEIALVTDEDGAIVEVRTHLPSP